MVPPGPGPWSLAGVREPGLEFYASTAAAPPTGGAQAVPVGLASVHLGQVGCQVVIKTACPRSGKPGAWRSGRPA